MIEHCKTRKSGILKLYKFFDVQFNLTLCVLNLTWRGLNFVSRKLSNQSLKWNSSFFDIFFYFLCKIDRFCLSFMFPTNVAVHTIVFHMCTSMGAANIKCLLCLQIKSPDSAAARKKVMIFFYTATYTPIIVNLRQNNSLDLLPPGNIHSVGSEIRIRVNQWKLCGTHNWRSFSSSQNKRERNNLSGSPRPR